ncbi:TPA: helix-turn-helix domain-containing protein [Klebsiella quasipneumoniae subsp. quasipneumoniae]|nr:helix-turn-helix domain-containing protein [Klebsiella quasipneumoniae subsp. quasipneumoniae]
MSSKVLRASQALEFKQKIIWDVVEWIESDLSREMTARTVAERSGYTQWYFQRLFKTVTGYSLVYYIRSRRVTVAAELLKTTNFLISEIYSRVGFYESSLFSRVFQRHFGVSPTAFRTSKNDFSSKMILQLHRKRFC